MSSVGNCDPESSGGWWSRLQVAPGADSDASQDVAEIPRVDDDGCEIVVMRQPLQRNEHLGKYALSRFVVVCP